MSATISQEKQSRVGWLPVVVSLLALLLVIGLGYGGFRAFASAPDLSAFNLYALAVVAGVASFFSPCAFPLLPSYFAFYHRAQAKAEAASSASRRALRLGTGAALGVLSFDLLLGLGIALLGAGLAQGLSVTGPQSNQWVQALRGVVGAALLLLGIGQWRGWNLKSYLAEVFAYRTRPEREGRRSPAANLYFYGLGYTAAGMGCTGPILAGLVVLALASGGFASALTAFLLFALTMGGLMLLVSTLVAASQESLIGRLKAAGPRIQSASSMALVLVGVFNIAAVLFRDWFSAFLLP